MTDYERLRVAYCYDVRLPSRLAAPIQILQTCHAMARLGVSVRVYVNRVDAPGAAECLAFYGLSPHKRLQILPWYAEGPVTAARLRPLIASGSRQRPLLLISRGEPGLACFGQLPAHRPEGFLALYEAHRLCFPEAALRVPAGLPLPLRAPLARWRTARTWLAERRALARADAVLCLTDGVRAALERSFGLRRPHLLLPSGVARPAEAPPDDARRDIDILYAGKLERRKGVHHLVAALAYLPAARLWIVGGGPEEIAPLRALAGQHGVAERITFTGFVPPAEVEQFYRRARVGVCPLPQGESAIADQYTSPLKLLSMMAHGTPIVATDVPPLRAILDERSASFAPPNQPAGLAAAIEALLADRPRALRLAQSAWARSLEYTWERRATRLLSFAATLLDGAPHPGVAEEPGVESYPR